MNVIKSLCGVVVMAVLLPLEVVLGELEKWCMVGILCASRWGRDEAGRVEDEVERFLRERNGI